MGGLSMIIHQLLYVVLMLISTEFSLCLILPPSKIIYFSIFCSKLHGMAPVIQTNVAY
jgi:hypothetical protein